MKRWLLAAEADKIQDFIFRSSRLVQVAGGSGLLARFCEDVPPLLIKHHTGRRPEKDDPDIVIAAGGGFRLTFDKEETAEEVSRDLAEAYYRATGSSLTVARPQPYDNDCFAEASREANADLRAKKTDRRSQSAATAHLPYVAFCASCGVSLATRFKARHTDDRPNYLCTSCHHKAAERDMIWQAPEQERFLKIFFDALKNTELAEDLPKHPSSEQLRDLFPRDANQVGYYDSRGYVAYLVADGNGMGVFFSQCQDIPTMQQFSRSLTKAMWMALAQATAKLSPRLWDDTDQEKQIPVMPLIVGGDDLFALVPAPYALDFARQVCLEFENEMQETVKELQFTEEPPTMAAAVVICKKNYPYALAHRQGEALLGRTKQLVRAARLQEGVNLSAVDFAIIRGGDPEMSAEGSYGGRKHVAPTLAPYWVSGDSIPDTAQEYGLNLQQFLNTRYDLRMLPGKRRAELWDLFTAGLPGEEGMRPATLKSLDDDWQPRLKALLDRIGRHPDDYKSLQKALDTLGDADNTRRPWRRCAGRPHSPYAHGLPDLLELWDFGQDLTLSLEAYEEDGK